MSTGYPFLFGLSYFCVQAWEEFNNSICMLFNAPRLRNPVWLSLAERETDEHLLAGEFCDQLAYLVDKLDTKECN